MNAHCCTFLVAVAIFASTPFSLSSTAVPNKAPSLADNRLRQYFQSETRQLADGCLSGIHSRADWEKRRPQLRQELFEMLSLSPCPDRTPLQPVVTAKLESEEFTVENLHFQSMPGLYVTGNLYLPKHLERPAPAILYVCGHAYVITNGVSYGNKVAYQHHGEWFARNGYVCLTIDTVQLGEIQGLHHGTYREGMWWWNSRGYTPAGVEAWNGIRALDYLQSRPEVDPERLGVTGRSGGGAYSWWITALDDRIKVAAPVAGMTDLQNYIVDGTVEGHCDCMFLVNTYRWDYPTVAALIAPRPLLIGNSDKDSIFPLDGVIRLHEKVAQIYKLYGATNHLGLLITEGPHHDTQDLQLPVFRWFNRFLKGEDPIIETAAKPFFTGQQLKVFKSVPADERTSRIHESFVPKAAIPSVPADRRTWSTLREQWKSALRHKVFAGWPAHEPDLNLVLHAQNEQGHQRLQVYDFDSEHDVRLRLYLLWPDTHHTPTQLKLTVADQNSWADWVRSTAPAFPAALRQETEVLEFKAAGEPSEIDAADPSHAIQACFAPRGMAMDSWSVGPQEFVQIRRRFMLLGQTLDGMRVWDIRRALAAVRSLPDVKQLPVRLAAGGSEGINALFAAIDTEGLKELQLISIPNTQREGPDYLNVSRYLDVPQAVALVAENTPVVLHQTDSSVWRFPSETAENLHWPLQQVRFAP